MARLKQSWFTPLRILSLLVAIAVTQMGLASAHVTDDHGPGGTAPVRPFRLEQVRLGPGLLQEKRDRIKEFIKAYDERRFLVLFNNQAGRPNPKGVQVPGGWEDGGLLSGHWIGHYMTALSQAYADQGENVYKTKLDWMVNELAICQAAISARIGRNVTSHTDEGAAEAAWIPTHPGYLGALPEDTVLRLGPPRWAVYGADLNKNTWAPWYTQHKIMRGLLDAYYNTNNTKALDTVVKMANWAHLALTIGDKNQPGYTGNLTRSDLNYMWDLYIAGEFGGANEVFPEIFQLTGDSRHLETGKAFDNRESLFGAAVQDHDILVVPADKIPGRRRAQRLHANTHVPQFLGYLSVYEHSGEQQYFSAAKNFYGWVVPHREFAHGGTGGNYPGSNDNPELFQNRDNIANAIAHNGAETCTTYNMLKLARNLFLHEHNATYMDKYERGLFNMIPGSRADKSSKTDPLLTYFQPLTPGSSREFGNTGTCCGGTGMESHTKYQETVYLRSADGSALWVNLFIPSTLTWTEKNLTITQETKFPRSDTTRLTITGSGQLDIKIRVPAWVRKGFSVTVNGNPIDETAQPSTYLTLSRTWTSGDIIQIHMPFTLRTERALDRPDTQALMWGPLLLQLLGQPSGNSSFHTLSLYQHLKLDGDYVSAGTKSTSAAGDTLFTFDTANGKIQARPYYIADDSATSSYFRRVEPKVVFGAVNTGIPNRKRNDHLPNYDVPVQGVTSPGSDGPTFLDVLWDKAPFESHAKFVAAVRSVADAFVADGIYNAAEKEKIVAGAEKAESSLAA